jgi:D-alanyl-D-alanine carboxypeptidase/D-alanyl-D-alanine-endopeptidase (penicillin-binding protein 4)
LGPEFRFRTRVHAIGPRPVGDGILDGDLILVACGDPTLTGAELTRMCEAVAASGIARVRGRLEVDDTRHDRRRSVPGWPPYYVPDFTGPLSGFAVDRNRPRRDPAFLTDPVPVHAERMRAALGAAGVKVDRPSVVGTTPPRSSEVVAEQVSAPLAEIGASILLRSDTFSAEMLLKELGARGTTGTTARGLAVLKSLVAGLGVEDAESEVDGSGLAAGNVDSPRRHVSWLAALERTAIGDLFRRSLPVAGQSGTLTRRFSGTPAAGRVWAKTGTRRLSGTFNLAGYANTLDGRRLRFSFVVSGARCHRDALAALDRAVVRLVVGTP